MPGPEVQFKGREENKMKYQALIKIFIFLILMNCFPVISFAYDDYEHLYVEVTEVPYKPVYAFLNLNLQGGSSQSGGSLGLTSARNSDLQFETLVGYRTINTGSGSSNNISSFDIMAGGALFPRKPNFVFMGMPVRLKISLLGGMSMASQADNGYTVFGACVNASLVFSSGDDPSGLTVGISYWPSLSSGDLNMPSSVCASIGFSFAPSAQ